MKKYHRNLREFEKLKSQLKQIETIVKNSKSKSLWSHEASVRKKIKALKGMQSRDLKGYDRVCKDYLALLDGISMRILAYYNKKNHTDFVFDEIVEKDRAGYISAGILSVLMTSHIPALVAEDFNRYFPANPKDEFPVTRAMNRKIFLHLGETNTGKTYHAIERLKQARNGVYLAPLRILALENFEKLSREGFPCNLLTGEEEIVTEGARYTSSTIEKLDLSKIYGVAVIDEIQMIENTQRGQAWTRALLGLRCNELHICGALNAKELILQILEDCGDHCEVTEYQRQTPLEVCEIPFDLGHAQKGDALVVFSKRQVLALARHFQDKQVKTSVIYGDLPPEVRRMQYETFVKQESDILVTTDAIGMGVNLPIRRIIFMDIQKFDGEEMRYLTSQEVKQIGGRAGRKGIYEVGYVGVSGLSQGFIKENLETPDRPVSQAVLGPSEAILKIGSLPLKEKLALWSTREETLAYYRKMDVRDYLLLLEIIKKYRLPEKTQYRLMKLPFDVHNNALLECFLEYVEEHFKDGSERLSRLDYSSETLSELELYYQKINLYYSFCKNFAVAFDENWVYSEREKVSNRINALLLQLKNR